MNKSKKKYQDKNRRYGWCIRCGQEIRGESPYKIKKLVHCEKCREHLRDYYRFRWKLIR